MWLAIAAVSRILYFLIVREAAVDTYAYAQNALAKTGAETPVLSSGLAYAYTEQLSDLLRLFGNNPAVLVGFQTILQILWLVLIFISVRFLWGELAGYITSTILLVSPYMFQIIKVVEPANFIVSLGNLIVFIKCISKPDSKERMVSKQFRRIVPHINRILSGSGLHMELYWVWIACSYGICTGTKPQGFK